MQDRSRLTTSLQESCSIFSNNNARIGKAKASGVYLAFIR